MLLTAPPLVLPGGEAAKNDWALVERLWDLLHQARLCRHSAVIAIGGGALLDLVGFAAATAHRGIPLVRLPTTALAQGDGGIGVKNAVNRFAKKNWIGTFQPPRAVINDTDFLRGQSPRHLRGGLVEALKVALIRDSAFYRDLLAQRAALARLDHAAVVAALQRSAALHLAHIAGSGDPFEWGSARPLDFGHWVAHKLEALTGYAVTHGEAVAIGMAVDLQYAVASGLLAAPVADEILALMTELGFPCWHPLLAWHDAAPPAILAGLEEFREHLGGELTITLVTAPGQSREVHTVEPGALRAACAVLARRAGAATP
jgi:3-dehydroquinate synthase